MDKKESSALSCSLSHPLSAQLAHMDLSKVTMRVRKEACESFLRLCKLLFFSLFLFVNVFFVGVEMPDVLVEQLGAIASHVVEKLIQVKNCFRPPVAAINSKTGRHDVCRKSDATRRADCDFDGASRRESAARLSQTYSRARPRRLDQVREEMKKWFFSCFFYFFSFFSALLTETLNDTEKLLAWVNQSFFFFS